jgi:hypothetical protein
LLVPLIALARGRVLDLDPRSDPCLAVWDHNHAFLLIPLALVWPRFSLAWFDLPLLYFTYLLPRPWLPSGELKSGGAACCPPEDVPTSFWTLTHASPALWPAFGYAVAGATLIAVSEWRLSARRDLSSG